MNWELIAISALFATSLLLINHDLGEHNQAMKYKQNYETAMGAFENVARNTHGIVSKRFVCKSVR